MSVVNNGTDPTVTVENKKQTITIGNGVALAAKPTITVEKEKVIIDEIERHCKKWRRISNAYLISIVLFGVTAVSTSVIVSIYTGVDTSVMEVNTIKKLACISTISLGILTAFNLVANGSNARNAWRSLNAALMLYTAGSISIQQLIEHYQQGESQLGSLSFNYGTNGDRPATFAQDIQASDTERKQREATHTASKENKALPIQQDGSSDTEQTNDDSDTEQLLSKVINDDSEEENPELKPKGRE